MDRPNPGRIYDVADGAPASQVDVYACAAALLGRPAPRTIPFDQAELSDMARSFWSDDVAIRARRIRDELGVGGLIATLALAVPAAALGWKSVAGLRSLR